MKKLLFLLLFLPLAIWLGFWLQRDPGYILITRRSWSVETSLWMGVLILLFLFFCFYAFLRAFHNTRKLGQQVTLWNKRRQQKKANRILNQAVKALLARQWAFSEQLFSKSAQDSYFPLLHYAAAAYAAQQQNATDRRDDYLSSALLMDKGQDSEEKTAKLLQCYFYIDAKQWRLALEILHALRKKYPKDSATLHLSALALEALGDWEALCALLPQMAKLYAPAKLQALSVSTYVAILKHGTTAQQLTQTWSHIPKAYRTHASIVAAYAEQARTLTLAQEETAITLIERAMKQQGDEILMTQYGLLHSERAGKQITQAETWLTQYAGMPALLLCLGRLCLREKLWGKARDYLFKALALATLPEIHYELGRLFEALEDPAAALEHYRKAADSALPHGVLSSSKKKNASAPRIG